MEGVTTTSNRFYQRMENHDTPYGGEENFCTGETIPSPTIFHQMFAKLAEQATTAECSITIQTYCIL